jgi:putative intracellular protease/amidase
MSVNPNVTRPNAKKTVLMVVANPSTSATTGWPVGFWWAEVTHPYWAFVEAGYEVEIRSPQGGALQADGYSDPEDASGYSAHDILSLGFKKSPAHLALIQDTKSTAEVDPRAYDAVFFAGGQSPMVTFRGNEKLQKLLAAFYEARRIDGTNFVVDQMFREFAVRDGLLVTGQQQYSGAAAARLVIEALGR